MWMLTLKHILPHSKNTSTNTCIRKNKVSHSHKACFGTKWKIWHNVIESCEAIILYQCQPRYNMQREKKKLTQHAKEIIEQPYKVVTMHIKYKKTWCDLMTWK